VFPFLQFLFPKWKIVPETEYGREQEIPFREHVPEMAIAVPSVFPKWKICVPDVPEMEKPISCALNTTPRNFYFKSKGSGSGGLYCVASYHY